MCPMRFFTTEGPVRPDDHYNLPPLSRWDLDEIVNPGQALRTPSGHFLP